jgi:uncharacterized protein YdeI (BOF family)
MILAKHTRLFLYLSLLIILSESCVTRIHSVYKRQDKLQGKNVMVKGEVISSLELYDLYCFTIRDKSGKIMIVTDNLLPVKNDKVRVKGILEKNFIYKNQTMLVIKEKKIKAPKPEVSKKKINKI